MAREPDFQGDRARLVADLVRAGDIRSSDVREAFLRVPREAFVRPEYRGAAYEDAPLPIGEGQTISAPSMIAIMLEEAVLQAGEHVLEVGTGSGYHAALLACLVGAANVVTVERVLPLAEWGRSNLAQAGFAEVAVVTGDGSLGYPPRAPYDCILGTAGAPRLPPAWAGQLTAHGRILAPVGGSRYYQDLVIARRRPDGTLDVRRGTPCAFVPLIGEQAWSDR
jgi:protein-L-isoaspartate(D-aspartate) O-methyltransferase